MRSLLLLFILLSAAAPAQSGFNQYNSKGKKQGYWKVFFNERSTIVSDSTQACFYGYVYFDNGKKIIYPDNTRWQNTKKFTYTGVAPKKGIPVPIHGTFCWVVRKNVITDVYENGYIKQEEVKKMSRSDSTDHTYREIIYFDQHYEGQEGSCRYELYFYGSKTSTPEVSYFRKVNGKWKIIKVKT